MLILLIAFLLICFWLLKEVSGIFLVLLVLYAVVRLFLYFSRSFFSEVKRTVKNSPD